MMNKQVLSVFSILTVLIAVLLFTANTSASQYDSVTLSELSQNKEASIELRISATIELGNISDQNSIIAIGRATRDDLIELRLAAIRAVDSWQNRARWDIISPLLNDPIAKVRYEAALAVIQLWPLLNDGQKQVVDEQVEAYILLLPSNDEALIERAYLYRIRENYEQAEILFTLLLNREPESNAVQNIVYLEYAELLRSTGRNQQAINLLENVVEEYQTSSDLFFSLGLAYYREGDMAAAISNLKRANELNSDDARVSYTLALLIKEQDPTAAIELLSQAYQVNAQPKYLYSLCNLQLEFEIDATECLESLRLVVPEQIVDELMLSNNKH